MQEIKVGDMLECDFSDEDTPLRMRGTVEKVDGAHIHIGNLDILKGRWAGAQCNFSTNYIKEYGYIITNLSRNPTLINVLRHVKRKDLTNTK